MNFNSLLIKFSYKYIAFFLGSFFTFYLTKHFNIDSVISSCLIGLISTFIPLPSFVNKTIFQASCYSGSFAGMCSIVYNLGFIDFTIISSLGALFFILLSEKFNGYGGKMGMIAFISVSLSFFILGGYL